MLTTETQGISVSRFAMEMEVVGDGRPLALVGGGLTGSRSWIPHAEQLAATRRVARLQPLNVQLGLEGRPLPDGYSIATESAALNAALDDAGWMDPLDLVAWSYGALIALDFALDHPDRIRTLTLIEPPAMWVLGESDWKDPALQAVNALVVGEDVGAADLAAFIRSVGLVPPGGNPSDLPQWGVWMEHRQSLRMLRVPLEHTDDSARLASFDKPVLLVTGTGTAAFHRRIQEVLAEKMPISDLVELPGGHAPNVVSMDRFLELLLKFQEDLGLSRTGTDARGSSPMAAHAPGDEHHANAEGHGSTSDTQPPISDAGYSISDVQHAVSDVQHAVSDVQYAVSDAQRPILDVQHAVSDAQHPILDARHTVSDGPHSAADVYHAVSTDGASIGYRRTGTGTPILFVHGTAADHRSWSNFAKYVEEDVAVHAMDRRGRGMSSDGPEYHLLREAEDVAAVVDAIAKDSRESVYLFGHSYGGLVSLEAALLTENVAGLILYEPPIPSGEATLPAAVTEKIQTLVDSGELEAAMVLTLREVALIPEHELQAYRQAPLWEMRIPLATTIPREMEIDGTYAFDGPRFAELDIPIYLLLGSESPQAYRQAIERLHRAIPHGKVIVLQGQQHLAHHTAPELLAETIRRVVP